MKPNLFHPQCHGGLWGSHQTMLAAGGASGRCLPGTSSSVDELDRFLSSTLHHLNSNPFDDTTSAVTGFSDRDLQTSGVPPGTAPAALPGLDPFFTAPVSEMDLLDVLLDDTDLLDADIRTDTAGQPPVLVQLGENPSDLAAVGVPAVVGKPVAPMADASDAMLPFEDLMGSLPADDMLIFPDTAGSSSAALFGEDNIVSADVASSPHASTGHEGGLDERGVKQFAAISAKADYSRRVLRTSKACVSLPHPSGNGPDEAVLLQAFAAAAEAIDLLTNASQWLPFTQSGLRELQECSSRLEDAMHQQHEALRVYLDAHPEAAARHDAACSSESDSELLSTLRSRRARGVKRTRAERRARNTAVRVPGAARPARFTKRTSAASRARSRVVAGGKGRRAMVVKSEPPISGAATAIHTPAFYPSTVHSRGRSPTSGSSRSPATSPAAVPSRGVAQLGASGASCPGCTPDGPVWGTAARKAAGLGKKDKKGRTKKHASLPGEKVDPILNSAISKGCRVSGAEPLGCVCVCVCVCVTVPC